MNRIPSFFQPSSYWELNRALREIVDTESWLVSRVNNFFADCSQGQGDLPEDVAPQGMAALACVLRNIGKMKYRSSLTVLLLNFRQQKPSLLMFHSR